MPIDHTNPFAAHILGERAMNYPTVNKAALDVLLERQRQVEQEGWTPEHDDSHANGALAIAAAHYAVEHTDARVNDPHDVSGWIKPTTERRNLVKAGALILAEIERLDRAEGR